MGATFLSNPFRQNGGTSISEADLPVPVAILTNKVVPHWWGTLKGTVVEKTDTTVTIENAGDRLTIEVPQSVLINDTRLRSGYPTKIIKMPLSQLPLGVQVEGSAFFEKNGGVNLSGLSIEDSTQPSQ